ncbi:MAG TPA: hypothetical protein VFW35_12155 [Sphingomicrobium sp.]|nr:hypothetical protein [Sphingomicrobium sp.]
MPIAIAAALALAATQSPRTAGTPVESNLEYVAPIAGNWTYAPTSDGSEATFANASGQPQLTIRCTRSTRRVAILENAAAPSPSMWIWTSSQSRSLPASYDAASGRVSTEFGAYDPFLDAMVSSRGRIGFSTSGLAALVVPPWTEVARVIEDCRV